MKFTKTPFSIREVCYEKEENSYLSVETFSVYQGENGVCYKCESDFEATTEPLKPSTPVERKPIVKMTADEIRDLPQQSYTIQGRCYIPIPYVIRDERLYAIEYATHSSASSAVLRFAQKPDIQEKLIQPDYNPVDKLLKNAFGLREDQADIVLAILKEFSNVDSVNLATRPIIFTYEDFYLAQYNLIQLCNRINDGRAKASFIMNETLLRQYPEGNDDIPVSLNDIALIQRVPPIYTYIAILGITHKYTQDESYDSYSIWTISSNIAMHIGINPLDKHTYMQLEKTIFNALGGYFSRMDARLDAVANGKDEPSSSRASLTN